MNELQRLHDEFDFTNSATPKFNVSVQFILSESVVFDPSFDVSDFVQQIRRRATRINERLVLTQEFVGQLATACDSPRFDQCDPFPRFTKAGVIIFHALK